ncbi:hypothetical protein H072_8756 [Dactylellina haptotyla CBS 200.50]|uniref:Uncharacterized protein n=1 Tax=Dactylellina haptotyla (strain CBS 200.50) TaxID=1284197 RepID=S8A3E6_DACHA|nr:hypothetical protein H072_8756 [Dactylellina haptotyla CBS 200.50]
MSRRAHITSCAIYALLGFLSIADAFYLAAIRASPTRPPGLPSWGWQPTDDESNGVGVCQRAGNEAVGWLQAFGIVNNADPPPGLPQGNARGFIFYTDADCRKDESEKMLYIHFDLSSSDPQVVNFRNLAWSPNHEQSAFLSENKYRSFKQVALDDPEPFSGLEDKNLPDTYVYVAESYLDHDDQPVWIGQVLSAGVTRLNVVSLLTGQETNPSKAAFDALVSYMSVVGQIVQASKQLAQYVDSRTEELGNSSMIVGSQHLSPTGMLQLGSQSMLPNQPNPSTYSIQEAESSNIMDFNLDGIDDSSTMARISLPLYGDTDLGTLDTRARIRHPYFTPEQEEEAPRFPGKNRFMTLEDFVNPVMEPNAVFDPNEILREVQERYTGVLEENRGIMEMANWQNLNDMGVDTVDKVGAAMRIMTNGMAWVEDLGKQVEKLTEAQQRFLQAIDVEMSKLVLLEANYEGYRAEMSAVIDNYKQLLAPGQEEEDEYYEAIYNIENSADTFTERAAPMNQRVAQYRNDIRANEQEFWTHALKTFEYLQKIEIGLQWFKDQLGLNSPVDAHGIDDVQSIASADLEDVVRLTDPNIASINNLNSDELENMFSANRWEGGLGNTGADSDPHLE